jgi:uncharacterized protein YecE (DUF72 family)
MGRAHIGTSGWYYKHWHDSFYPQDVPKNKQLEYYATIFSTVEINATFYRLPSEKMVQGWHDKVPDDFVYAVKGSRLITHYKRLKDVDESVQVFFDRINGLAERLGPILWQLPPSMKKDLPRLVSFIKTLPKDVRHAVEFRHPSWMDDETMSLLKDYQIALVWLSSMLMPEDFTITSDFVYARFHGLEGGAAYDYQDDVLGPWSDRISDALDAGCDVYAYFNNDWNYRAPLNAQRLIELVGERTTAHH